MEAEENKGNGFEIARDWPLGLGGMDVNMRVLKNPQELNSTPELWDVCVRKRIQRTAVSP